MASDTIFTCTKCPAEFKTQRGLDNHKCRWFCKKCGNRFKTAAGYDRHMAKLCGSAKQADLVRQDRERLDKVLEEYTVAWAQLQEKELFTPKYKEGDTVYISGYYVSKPTHQQRGSRRVRVLYEEERQYFAEKRNIERVLQPDMSELYNMKYCIENNSQFNVKYHVGYRDIILQIFDTLEEAKSHSGDVAKRYKEACDHASRCR